MDKITPNREQKRKIDQRLAELKQIPGGLQAAAAVSGAAGVGYPISNAELDAMLRAQNQLVEKPRPLTPAERLAQLQNQQKQLMEGRLQLQDQYANGWGNFFMQLVFEFAKKEPFLVVKDTPEELIMIAAKFTEAVRTAIDEYKHSTKGNAPIDPLLIAVEENLKNEIIIATEETYNQQEKEKEVRDKRRYQEEQDSNPERV